MHQNEGGRRNRCMSYLVIMVLSNNVSKGSNENIGYCFFESQLSTLLVSCVINTKS